MFIVSGGRTGTKYFGDTLGSIIRDARSFHEPDVINPEVWKEPGKEFPRLIRDFGVYNVVLGRILGRTGMRNLSQRHLSGRLDLNELVKELQKQRRRVYRRMAEPLIIESNLGFYGVLPGLKALFPACKIAVFIRDPRTWVPSIINWGTMYGDRDWVTKLGFGRLTPNLIGDRYYAARWRQMPRFEKVCWAWKAINSIILRDIAGHTDARVFRYEDLFESPSRESHFFALMDYLTSFSDRRFAYAKAPSVLNERIHRSPRQIIPAWNNWSPPQAAALDQICGPMMGRFHYGLEPQWQALLQA
ncbi:MAG: hypothetical protein GWN84_15865 [Gammaproteobacteria bacterium]|nr:hypothetical protein [Gammaproteobacteria bacterium]NIR84260.1 hypothetical protein [Gammaproteobacteria bacterium]NIR89730.1 hypothetical protein [Gammaproteobacteria bacterium]NIU05418.1 hypothetical protein [Gammaproteobacteria bacterium]NIV52364.1 hypothetical protein [Gammaproteobacteria bacterium]